MFISSRIFLSPFSKANIVVSFLVDVALGMFLISWLYRDNHITMLANTLVPAADVSVWKSSLAMFACRVIDIGI